MDVSDTSSVVIGKTLSFSLLVEVDSSLIWVTSLAVVLLQLSAAVLDYYIEYILFG